MVLLKIFTWHNLHSLATDHLFVLNNCVRLENVISVDNSKQQLDIFSDVLLHDNIDLTI